MLDPEIGESIDNFFCGCDIGCATHWRVECVIVAHRSVFRRGGSAAGELTSLLSSEIEINKCNVQCCVYIADGGKWRLSQNNALGPIALDSESTTPGPVWRDGSQQQEETRDIRGYIEVSRLCELPRPSRVDDAPSSPVAPL